MSMHVLVMYLIWKEVWQICTFEKVKISTVKKYTSSLWGREDESIRCCKAVAPVRCYVVGLGLSKILRVYICICKANQQSVAVGTSLELEEYLSREQCQTCQT